MEQLVHLARARKIRVLEGRFVEHDRAFAHQGFCELIARTLTRMGGGRPLLLVVEELHRAELSIEALQYIVRRLAPTPTLIVGTYRQTEIDKRHPLLRMVESFRGDPRFAALTLGPLSASEHRALVEQAAGSGKLSDALARRLLEATEGNPLFTKEIVRSLLDSGGIATDDSGAISLSGTTGISADALPETIQQAVEGRVQRLPEGLREILAVAAVLGRSFEFRDLESLAEGTELEDAVDALVRGPP